MFCSFFLTNKVSVRIWIFYSGNYFLFFWLIFEWKLTNKGNTRKGKEAVVQISKFNMELAQEWLLI